MIKFRHILSAAAVILMAASCSTTGKIAVTAHRGYWNCDEGGYARNSIAALAAAQNHAFWGSEFDVQMTRDLVLVVHHDADIDGVRIWNHDFSDFKDSRLENGESIPTLDAYLAQGEKSKTVLVCELKEQKDAAHEDYMVDQCVKAVKEHNLYDPSRIIFISFRFNICQRLAGLCPGFTVQYLGDNISPDELYKDGINGVDYYHKTFQNHPTWYQQARDHAMSINSWTCNSDEEIQSMIDQKVDCITTDYPDKARQMIGKGKETPQNK